MEVLPSDISKILCKVPRPPLKRGATAFLHVWPGFSRRGNRSSGGTIILGAPPSRLPRRIPFFGRELFTHRGAREEKDMPRADAAWRPFFDQKMDGIRWQTCFADEYSQQLSTRWEQPEYFPHQPYKQAMATACTTSDSSCLLLNVGSICISEVVVYHPSSTHIFPSASKLIKIMNK